MRQVCYVSNELKLGLCRPIFFEPFLSLPSYDSRVPKLGEYVAGVSDIADQPTHACLPVNIPVSFIF